MTNYEQRKFRSLLILSLIFSFIIPAIIRTVFEFDIQSDFPILAKTIVTVLKDISWISEYIGVAIIIISVMSYSFKKSLIVAIPYLIYSLCYYLYYFIITIQSYQITFKHIPNNSNYYYTNLYGNVIQFIIEMLLPIIIIFLTRLLKRVFSKIILVFLYSAIIVFLVNIVYFFFDLAVSFLLFSIYPIKEISMSNITAIYLKSLLPSIATYAINVLIILCTGILYYYLNKRMANKKIKSSRLFSSKAQIYAKYRPSYSTEFIDYLYSKVGFNDKSTIADIGSGTGILSRLLLEKGSAVYCVEPNKDMAKLAKANLSEFSGFIPISSTAEKTCLTDKSIDYITVAQAFHWFDAEKFKQECKRILNPNGKVVLVWNSRVEGDTLVTENDELCRRICPNFVGFSGGLNDGDDKIKEFFKDGAYELRTFNNDRKLTLESFIGGSLSSSYAPVESDTNYKPFIAGLIELFNKYSKDGILTMPNITRCYIGEV
jgi:ubiquinone/menaquinone biosynthesis C-methylase UbiE